MTTVFKLADKVSPFKAKVDLWAKRVDRGVCDMFQTYTERVGENDCRPLWTLMRDHLRAPSAEFERHFPSTKDPRTGKEWIHDPFASEASSLTMEQEDKLLQLKNDGGLKTSLHILFHSSGLK